VAQLAQETYNANVLPLLIKNLGKLEFESKKDVALIFNNLLRRQIGTRSPTVEYLCARHEILLALVKGYESPDIAMTCGTMLKECIRHEHLAKIILYSEQFYDFFSYVEVSTFDIASDAFSTFKVRVKLARFVKFSLLGLGHKAQTTLCRVFGKKL
jgi:calcium binding protein 39